MDIEEISHLFEHSLPDENTILHLASIGGNITQVRYCVEVLCRDQNDTNKQGKNALQLAAQVGHSTIVCYLKEFVMENSIYSSINLAALNGHYKLVKTLVSEHQVDPLWCIDQGLNPLQCSFVNGDERIVKFLIEEAKNSQPIPDFIRVTTSSGDTLLHLAALSGSMKLTEYLINKLKCRPDVVNDRGVAPFHIAVHTGNEKLVSFYHKHVIAKTLLVESTGQNALHIAAIKGHKHLFKDLISIKVDPTAKDMLGCTPLHYVALSGSLEMFQVLWRFVKVIDFTKVVDNEQHTILHYAVRSGSLDLVKFILWHQPVVISCKDNKQWTALHHAVDTTGAKSPQIFSHRKQKNCSEVTAENQLEMVRFLVEKKNCDPKLRIVGGYNLLHHPDNLQIIKYLLEELHLDPRSCDDDGRNALHHACMTGKLDLVQYLLNEHGCDLTCLNNNGNSVVHYACWGGDVNLLKFLTMERRCEPMCANQSGLTPLQHAAYFGHLELVRFYKEQLKVEINSANTIGLLGFAAISGNHILVQYLLEECDYKELTATHLILGCAAPHKKVLEYMVEKGQNLSFVDASGNTLLHKAMDLESFKYLLHLPEYTFNMPNKEGVTPLHIACEMGKLDIVQYLVNNCDASLSLKSSDGRMPFHFAAKGCNISVFMYLFNKHCNPKCTDLNGSTPLHLACSSDTPSYCIDSSKMLFEPGIHLRTVKMLVRDFKCDPHCIDHNKQTPLHLASRYGYSDVVRYLIDECQCDMLAKDIDKKVPLLIACQYGKVEIVKFLASKYFNASDMPCEVLHIASQHGQNSVIKYLIEHCKCDIMAKDYAGRVPLWYACKNHYEDVIDYLTSRMLLIGGEAIILLQQFETEEYEWISPHQVACKIGILKTVKLLVKREHSFEQTKIIHSACSGGKIDTVQYLFEECKGDKNCKDDAGNTPLHIATCYGHLPIIEYLIRLGCDPTVANIDGDTLAHLAALNEDLHIMKYFKDDLHWDFSTVNNQGQTPFHYACQEGSIDIIQYLIKECAVDISTTDKEENTPLIKAAMNGCLKVIEFLIKQGCDPKQRNTYGNTPLHIAASNGHLSTVKYFGKILNCDLSNTINNRSQNCLHIACIRGRINIVQYLVEECSVDINKQDKEGSTPISLAAQEGHLTVVEYLIKKRCDPLQRNDIGCTPADVAVAGGHLSVVKYFREKNLCDFNSANHLGLTALHVASLEGKLDTVKYLVKECAVNINSTVILDSAKVAMVVCSFLKDADPNATPDSLISEPYLSTAEVYYDLLRQGRNPNFVINTGLTPLLDASSRGSLPVIEFLIGEGCDSQCCDFLGNTPIHFAAQNGHLTVTKYLKERLNYDLSTTNNNGQMAIHQACAVGKISVVQYLVEEFAVELMNESKDDSSPLQAAAMPQDNEGNTPLHLAVQESQFEVIKFYMSDLINNLGVNPNTPNSEGATPLHLACRVGSMQIVKLFGECDICDFSVKDNNGRTLLHYVSWRSGDAVKIVMHLVRDKQCDPALPDNDGNTCLHLASVVQLLVCEFDCDPNCVNTQGNTPLQLASEESVIDYFLQLSSREKDHNVLSPIIPNLDILKQLTHDRTGPEIVSQSPVLRAIELDEPDQVNYCILDMGCSLRATDTNGNTFLHIAALHGAIRVTQLLLNTFECDPNCENECSRSNSPSFSLCKRREKYCRFIAQQL